MGWGAGGEHAETTRPPSQRIIEAVAQAEQIEPTDVCPPAYASLHDVIDPEALDALFASKHTGEPRPGGTLSFTFCGYDVFIDSNGVVSLEEIADTS